MKRGVKYLVTIVLSGALLLFSAFPAYADTNVYKIRTRVAEAIDYEKSYSNFAENSANVNVINGSVGYSYAEKVMVQVYFSDNLAHTGRLRYTNAASNTLWNSDNENVAVIGDTIYFYEKSAFTIYTYKYHYNQSLVSNNLVLDSTADITLGTFTEVTDPNDITSILDTISTNTTTMVSRLTNIRTYTQNILNELTNEIYGLAQFELKLEQIENLMEQRHDWDIPVESFPINWALFYSLGNNYQSIRNYDYWMKYPIFTVEPNTQIISSPISSNGYIDIIVGINQNVLASNINDYFSVSAGTLSLVRHIVNFSPSYRFFQMRISSENSAQVALTYTGSSTSKLIGIYLGRSDAHIGLSTSFIENWFSTGSEEDMMDDAVDDLDESTDNFDDIADDLYSLEDSWLDDMDDRLDNIDLSLDLNSNASFSSAASWVRARFNFLTRNNFSIFGDVITFSLTIGLILVLLGKLRS